MSSEKRFKDDEDDDDDDDRRQPTRSSNRKSNDADETESKSDDDTDSNASSEYEVEKILAKRRRRGALEYYIKWVGYDASANEWIPETSLNCPARVAEFERKEKQTRKGRDSRRRTHPARNSHRAKRRRVKIIDEYEDDEDEDITKSVASSISSSSKSTNLETTSRSVQFGVEKGYKVQAVLGINRTKGEQLHYLVHYQSPTSFEDNMELIPADVAKRFCEDEIIQFYETRITWNERRSE